MSESTLEVTARQRYWIEHLQACEAAGQTLVDYARTHDLGLKGLYNAKSRLVKLGLWSASSKRPEFYPVQIVACGVDEAQCRVRCLNGVVVEFTVARDERWLSAVLKAASELS